MGPLSMDVNTAMKAKGLLFKGITPDPVMKDKDPVSQSRNTITFAYKGEDSSEAVITFGTDGSGTLIGEPHVSLMQIANTTSTKTTFRYHEHWCKCKLLLAVPYAWWWIEKRSRQCQDGQLHLNWTTTSW